MQIDLKLICDCHLSNEAESRQFCILIILKQATQTLFTRTLHLVSPSEHEKKFPKVTIKCSFNSYKMVSRPYFSRKTSTTNSNHSSRLILLLPRITWVPPYTVPPSNHSYSTRLILFLPRIAVLALYCFSHESQFPCNIVPLTIHSRRLISRLPRITTNS